MVPPKGMAALYALGMTIVALPAVFVLAAIFLKVGLWNWL